MADRPTGPDGSVHPDLPSVAIDVDEHVDIHTSVAAETMARGEGRREAENLQRINRIVVLMENRSFDHMLGYLSLPPDLKGRGRSDVDGLEPGQSNPGVDGGSGGRPGSRRPPPVEIRPLTDGVFLDNPGHSKRRIAEQIAEGAMTGFVRDFADVVSKAKAEQPHRPHEPPEQIMGYHTAATVPVYDLLADQFTVCDKWFSSVPGPTWPNRMFLYAGTANGKTDNGASPLSKYKSYSPGMPTDLIVDRLDAAGVDWRIYRGSLIPWMRFFPSFLEPGQRRDRKRAVKRYASFNNDCRQDDLPPVVFIDPNSNVFTYAPLLNNDDQAPSDVARGQELVGEVYENLRKHGQLDETLFVVTYDEHGGFYDHVAPDPLPEFATTNDPEFTTFGVRVPSLVVSPFVEECSVCKDRSTTPRSPTRFSCGSAPGRT